VNGEIVNIPLYTLRIGDVVGVREKSKSLEAIVSSLTANNKKYDWLDWNNSDMSGRFISVPSREMIPENIKEQLIVELYSK
jgi:small subunit ribosomal protein S4